MEPEDFANHLIFDQLNCKVLVVGENYRFGKKAKGDRHLLKELAEKIISESTSDADEVDMQMTPTEVKVAEVVKQTLGVDSVDPNVNLYSYGANSLVMAQLAGELASMLEDESAFDNILMNLFENPTVRSTAAAIDSINNGNQ